MQASNAHWLIKSISEINRMSDKAYQKSISDLLDEQPHLMGFLFNLAEEFDEQTHELLLKATIVLYDALRETGILFNMIKPDDLELVLEEKVKLFDEIDLNAEFLDENKLFEDISSPEVVKSLRNFVLANTEVGDKANGNNILLILSVLVTLFENAAALPTDINTNSN